MSSRIRIRSLGVLLVVALLAPTSATAQNLLKLVNEASGTAPRLQAQGPDTNIDVNLVPKGTGCVRISGGACIGGGGTGTVTGSGTTNVLTLWTNGPGSVLGDSVFAQDTSAIVKKGSTASVGGIGFNNSGNVEVIADGSTVATAGLFTGAKVDFAIHDSVSENNWQFLIYNDDNGIANGVVLQNYGAYPNNSLQLVFGDGAGGTTNANHGDSFTPTLTQFGAPNLAVGQATVSGTNSAVIYLGGSGFYGLGTNNTFAVVRSATGNQYDNMVFAQSNNQTSMINFETTNNVVGGISAVCAADASGTCGGARTRGVASFDAQDATNTVTVTVITNPNAVKLTTNLTGAGTAPEFQWWTPGGLHSYVSLKAPDTTTGDLGVKMTLPSAYAAANGQPIVMSTTGVLSVAPGVTKTCGVLPTVVGGIITSC